ncbi:MAG: prolipoprotein diacylglyceryl transferase [Fibrobacterota bacterium]
MFYYWWQHIPERIHPDLIQVGFFHVRWYGFMYVVAFSLVYLLTTYRIKQKEINLSSPLLDRVLTWGILGTIIGARLGYVLFYNFKYYWHNPLEIILPFDISSGSWHYTGLSGMSFHGGLIGVFVSLWLCCRKANVPLTSVTDALAPVVPLGYAFGRIGNFINGELYGRLTSVSWGMYFPLAPSYRLRHPSQLYEALFEGFLLFAILWTTRKRLFLSPGAKTLAYLVGYASARFIIEFFREPDIQVGKFLGVMTMGQILCCLMILVGVLLYNKVCTRK